MAIGFLGSECGSRIGLAIGFLGSECGSRIGLAIALRHSSSRNYLLHWGFESFSFVLVGVNFKNQKKE